MSEAGTRTVADAKWYIVHTYSNFEKKVSEEIRRQAKLQELEEFVAEVGRHHDVNDPVAGSDGDPVVGAGPGVHDAVPEVVEHLGCNRRHLGGLRFLQQQDVGPRALEEPTQRRRPRPERVHVPRRHPEMLGGWTERRHLGPQRQRRLAT